MVLLLFGWQQPSANSPLDSLISERNALAFDDG